MCRESSVRLQREVFVHDGQSTVNGVFLWRRLLFAARRHFCSPPPFFKPCADIVAQAQMTSRVDGLRLIFLAGLERARRS